MWRLLLCYTYYKIQESYESTAQNENSTNHKPNATTLNIRLFKKQDYQTAEILENLLLRQEQIRLCH